MGEDVSTLANGTETEVKKGAFIALLAILVIGAGSVQGEFDLGEYFNAGWDGIVDTLSGAVTEGNALILVVAAPALYMLWRLLKLILNPEK